MKDKMAGGQHLGLLSLDLEQWHDHRDEKRSNQLNAGVLKKKQKSNMTVTMFICVVFKQIDIAAWNSEFTQCF